MTDKKYKYWLAVVDGQLVQFSELPHMMAIAMHPNGGLDYGAARINLEDELKLAVRDGLLRVRNPAGLGYHTFPHGDALQRAVMIPNIDLAPFLNARSIELRITPHGNGPKYWTLENAAAAMQEQLNWHDGTRAEFQDQLQEAAQSGAIVLLNPRTCLPYQPERVRTYWEYVTPDSVNNWLATLKAPYLWSPALPFVKDQTEPLETASDGPAQLAAPAWRLETSIKKWPGYRSPLYQFLKAAYVAGKPCPKAQDVLSAWKLNPPPGLEIITSGRHDELEYQLNHGHKKTADLKAIQAAIDGLVIQID